MTKMEGEDRMLAEFMTTLFSQRYPDLERESIHSYVEVSLGVLNYSLITLQHVRDTGYIGKFYTKFESRAV